MQEPPDLRIDLSDPASIRERLPGIETIVAEKRRVADEAAQDLETWDTLLKRLRSVAGLVVRIAKPDAQLPDAIPPAALEAVARIVNGSGRARMVPLSVEEALKAEGHEVEGRAAVYAALLAAAASGRIRQVGPRQFAPNSREMTTNEPATIKPVPEAHFALSGPAPQSKADAAIKVLSTDPDREWSTRDVAELMVEQDWMTGSEKDFATLASTLSRLVADGKIHRPQRGHYKLGLPGAPG